MTPPATSWLSLCQTQATHQQSFLCVGLDPDLDRLPAEFPKNELGIYEFCCHVIKATAPFCSAFKPQFAHFAGQRALGALEQICQIIRQKHPNHQLILDAKRGDIGSTATYYAREAFEVYQAHSCTVHPYMGFDSVKPYLEYGQKHGVFVLCRTSNESGNTFQSLFSGFQPLFERIAQEVREHWNTNNQCGLVLGATRPAELAHVRALCPDLPFLIPGIGAQGGDLKATIESAKPSKKTPSWINSSRAILYAESDKNESWQQACARVAKETHLHIQQLLTDS
jgi:orotidine-5'-phosphate decarboxylase